MTAINSHVAREIVDDCAAHDADLFVIYLGNNEVVGPYGAGTVFGSFSSRLAVVRAAIRLKALRIGQLLERALDAVNGGPGQDTWRGMEMFLEQQIARDDPRLGKVYDHFAANLRAMIAKAHRSGAETVLLTVATNLRDQPPFASAHRPDLEPDEASRWQAHSDAGVAAAAAGAAQRAVEAWQLAESIDDRYAELHFRLGRSLLALGHGEEALRHFLEARDLDTLRFRADSRINEVIREVAAQQAERGVTLIDTATQVAEGSPGPEDARSSSRESRASWLPGYRLFHEHVHLNFDGNRVVAEAVYEHLRARLSAATREAPRNLGAEASALHRPSREILTERLVFTEIDRLEMEREILRIVSRPPFTGQLDHSTDLEKRRMRLAGMTPTTDRESWERAQRQYRSRLAEDPRDLEIRRRFATLLQARRHSEAAAEHWRHLLERLPGVASWRADLATALADLGRRDEALAELATLSRANGETADLAVHRGSLLETLGDAAAAEDAYRSALRLRPNHPVARFNLANLALQRGDRTEAIAGYRALIEQQPTFAPGHHNLGRCLEQQGDTEGAITAYRQAVAADPMAASAHNSLGLALEKQGKPEAAAVAYRQALSTDPGYALARFNLADLELTQGRAAAAAEHYAEGLQARPDNTQARYNFAAALRILGRDAAAVAELERVLTVRPDDPGTLHNLAWILAASKDEALRKPRRAVDLAERAARVTARRSPEILETLAIAYRATGRAREARATLEQAVRRARDQGRAGFAAGLERQLATFP